jgi:hypothetical protein
MALIRAFEERVKALMESGVPFGVAHFSVPPSGRTTGSPPPTGATGTASPRASTCAR